jgi:serine/threonine protein kinase/Flp pilus assembly protein TadD
MAEQPASERTIFQAAIEKPSLAEREAYLDETCGDNEQLRQKVKALLAAHDRLPAPKEDAAEPPSGIELDPPILLTPPGTVVGRYKLLEQIGEGGYGTVFMAEQTTPVQRRVALKIIKPGMDTKQVIARFEAERQALALMDHPNIAKVFDAGVTDTGRPYFVMELVKGTAITKFCDEHRLSPRARLELFVQVCQAVQHAHQKGIIHRDLKPSNVLVGLYDGRPVPKVIDFGVAKATGQRLTEATMFTGFGDVIGTLEYMSPEQAEVNQLDVDTRSDIYSLGVLLYELLTGTTPLERKRVMMAGLLEMLRVVREEEPPKPSMRLSTTEQLASISASRGMEPNKLSGLVKGELDWIVMKALEKDRGRRYETANELASDVERYLADEAVLACPPSAGYRLRKLARRRRVPFILAAVFLCLLVVGTVVSTYQAIRIRAEQDKTLAQKLEADRQGNRAERERDRAVAAEQKALTEAHKSEQAATFMTDMLEGVGPAVALGRDTTMLREILDHTTTRLGELKDQPEVEADLRTVLGVVYSDLGNYQRAEAMFRPALALRRKTLGNKHVEVARSLSELAEALRKQSRYDEAEPLFGEGLAMQRELLGNDHPSVAMTLFRLGMLHNRRGTPAEAEKLFRQALGIFRQYPSEDLRGPLGQLALSLTRQGRYAEAEPVAQECVSECREHAPAGDPQLALALCNLGALFRSQSKYAEAEPYLREALTIQRKQLPPDHSDTLSSVTGLASALFGCGRGEEALPLVDECVQLADGKAAELRESVGRLMRERARFLFQAGRLREAVADFAKATELNPKDHLIWYDAADFYLYLGEVDRYRSACEAMLDRFEKASEDKPELAKYIVTACGMAPGSVSDFSRVERLALRCVTGTENHAQRRWFLHAKALTDYRSGRNEEAIEWLRRFTPRANGSQLDAGTFAVLAMAHHQVGHVKEAQAALDAARAIVAKEPKDVMRGSGLREWLHAELLYREAERLLKVSPASTQKSE